VILTQTQCEVCAVSERDVEQAVGDWIGGRPRIVSLAPNALADVFQDIQTVGDALGVWERRIRRVLTRLRERIASIVWKTKKLEARPTVACIEWIDPLMAAGNWVPELVEFAGGTNLFGEAGKHAPWMTFDQLFERDPDVILMMPCGFDIERTRQDMRLL